MRRSHFALAPAAAAVAALAVAGCGGSGSDADDATTGSTDGSSTLAGEVGPGFDISMTGTDGLAAGRYTFSVDDRSDIHNFHLTGPGGVDVATDVAGTGVQEFTVELQAGEYAFVCDPHNGTMNGSFAVG